jgi:hypothetical protein
MSAATATGRAASAPRSRLDAFRDDGPLARALGRLGAAVPVPAAILTPLAILPLVAVLAIEGDEASDVRLGIAVAWTVLTAGMGRGRPQGGRFAWVVPPLLRVLEYGGLLSLAVLAGPTAVPVCFALCGALAFHHYDTVYRLRHQGIAPPAWLSAAAGGWEGRLLVAFVLSVVGALETGFLVAATVLAVAYVAESVASWLRFAQPQRPALYDDEEDEDE